MKMWWGGGREGSACVKEMERLRHTLFHLPPPGMILHLHPCTGRFRIGVVCGEGAWCGMCLHGVFFLFLCKYVKERGRQEGKQVWGCVKGKVCVKRLLDYWIRLTSLPGITLPPSSHLHLTCGCLGGRVRRGKKDEGEMRDRRDQTGREA